MTSLIELEKDRSRLVENIMLMLESDEPEDALSALDELEKQISDKADAIAAVYAAKKGEIEYLKSRIESYQEMLTTRKNALERFEKYIKGILERREDPTIKGKSSKLTLVKNGGKAPLWIDEMVPIEQFPVEFVIEKTTLSLDKEKIREKLDDTKQFRFKGSLLAEELPRTYRLKIS